MAPQDAPMRALYRNLIRECDARVQQHGLAAASVFFTWGSNNAAAKDDLFEAGFGGGLDDGYQALIAAVHRDQRIVITWCWELYRLDVADLPSGNLLEIFKRLHERSRATETR